jgi:hypothetical protein
MKQVSSPGMAMKTELTLFTKLTVGGLVAVAIALWTQWLSGDPAYGKFPAGPVVFIGVAAIVAWGARWWWTPLIGSLISILVTSGWFARLPNEMLRLEHPEQVGKFAFGIFAGTALQISALLLTDVAGVAATVQNFHRSAGLADMAKMVCRFFGDLFLLTGVLVIVGGAHVDKYHNLMHMAWGALALGISFVGSTASRRFSIASGAFYLALAFLGFAIGNPSMNRAWHFGPMLLNTGDHIFHLVVGFIFLAVGLVSGRRFGQRSSPVASQG